MRVSSLPFLRSAVSRSHHHAAAPATAPKTGLKSEPARADLGSDGDDDRDDRSLHVPPDARIRARALRGMRARADGGRRQELLRLLSGRTPAWRVSDLRRPRRLLIAR